MTAGSQFRPAPPPAFGSAAFQEALAEVRGIVDTRTARQDSIAKFWAMGTGKLIAGFWNSTAAELIERHRLSEPEAAHALALMNTAAMDGLIACADANGSAAWPTMPGSRGCSGGSITGSTRTWG